MLRPGWTIAVLPAAIYILAVFYLGSVPNGPQLPVDVSFRDKVGHALAFGVMQWTHARAAAFFWPAWSTRQVAWWSFVSASLVGGLLEIWQLAFPHRSADWADFAVDVLGAAVGALLWLGIGRRR